MFAIGLKVMIVPFQKLISFRELLFCCVCFSTAALVLTVAYYM